jgi:predicted nucleotidyltransferase
MVKRYYSGEPLVINMNTSYSYLSPRHRIALWIFSLFPSILLVALCNSRAMGEYSKSSDIDLFIITKSEQIWTVRFLVTTISSILGVRRKNTHGLKK